MQVAALRLVILLQGVSVCLKKSQTTSEWYAVNWRFKTTLLTSKPDTKIIVQWASRKKGYRMILKFAQSPTPTDTRQKIVQVAALRLVILLQGVSVCLKKSQTTSEWYAVNWRFKTTLLTSKPDTKIIVQWASQKKRISYDFNFYVGSTRHIPKSFRSAALSTVTQPWWSADRPSQRRHGFISSTPGIPKIPISSKYHTWLIRPIRLPGNFHGRAPEIIFDFH